MALAGTFSVYLIIRNEPFGLIVFMCTIVGVLGTGIAWKRAYNYWRQYTNDENKKS